MDELPADSIITPSTPGGARRPTLTLDVALYESYLADRNLDAAQKQALLEALWGIIVGFVDLGFAVEPAAGPADKSNRSREEFASSGAALVDSSAQSTSNQFEKAAAQGASSNH